MLKTKKTLLLFFCLFLLTGCYSNRMYNYYSDDENYTEISGIIVKIEYNENYKALYVKVDYDNQKYDSFKNYDGIFKIIEENEKILSENLFYNGN